MASRNFGASEHPNPIIAEDVSRIVSSDLEWDLLAGCTVLVTGASGFLPAYMVETVMALRRHLESSGKPPPKVVALARSEAQAHARFSHHLQKSGFALLVQDVCTPLPSGFRPDFIVHAASLASPKHYRDDPIGTIRPNAAGTERLLERAKATDAKRFLFISSGEVYGDVPEAMVPTGESDFGQLDPTDPCACYAEAKRLGEALCIAWHRQAGVPASIVRPFHVYGPGIRLDDGRVFADFAADVLHGRDIALMSAGTARRSFCYLADATEGFFRILLHGKAGLAYNLGNPDCEVSVADLADMLARLYPEKGLKVVRTTRDPESQYLPSKINRICPRIDRIESLGWKPMTDIRTGFRRMIESLSFGAAP